MQKFTETFILLFFVLSVALSQASNANYNVVNYGAKPDGKTDSSKSFLSAWTLACKSPKAATVYVPKGTFLVGPIAFSGPCKNKIMFSIDGTIVAPTNYWKFGSSGFWILFYKVSGITVHGGALNGNGADFWACRKAGKVCPPGARSISFVGCSNVVVKKLTSLNSQLFHMSIDQSRYVTFENVRIISPITSPNTDGIHMQSSTGVTISSSTFQTGDDCISIGPGSKNVWIQNIACGPGHGISVGSLAESKSEDGVQNVTVTGVVFNGTQNGVRIKSWARPSNGSARNIVFQNIVMQNAQNPIIIDQKYCPSGEGCSNQNSGVKISGVTYKNIRGTSATKVAVWFVCSASNPCTGLKLQNIMLTYYNSSTATSYCSHASGSTGGAVIPRSCF